MPGVTDLKAALQNSSPDGGRQGLALGCDSFPQVAQAHPLWGLTASLVHLRSRDVEGVGGAGGEGECREGSRRSGGLWKSHNHFFKWLVY